MWKPDNNEGPICQRCPFPPVEQRQGPWTCPNCGSEYDFELIPDNEFDFDSGSKCPSCGQPLALVGAEAWHLRRYVHGVHPRDCLPEAASDE